MHIERSYKKWFAWHPVRFGNGTGDTGWWEWVWRAKARWIFDDGSLIGTTIAYFPLKDEEWARRMQPPRREHS